MADVFPLERSRGVLQDASRWTLIFPKIILEGLSLWPERQNCISTFLSFCLMINIGFLLVTHTAYFIQNIRDIVKMAELLTTVNITTQSFVRIATMIYYKKELKVLLLKVWKYFWHSSILGPEQDLQMRKLTKRYFSFVFSFGVAATCTTIQFMFQPMILGMRNLPLMQTLPFPFLDSPRFDILYVWNAITCMSIQFSVLGFDFFFTMLVWNCAMQYKILRIVLGNVVKDPDEVSAEESKKFANEMEKEAEETQRLIKCIKHHRKLTSMCDDMEVMFRYILLLQLLDSALALCVCSFAAVTVPSLFAKMVTFSLMYLMQLFLYCAFGNELLHQSMTLAYAAFRCGWHYSGNREIRKSILMLMQKSQNGQRLTARGFAVVNYTSCLQVLRMAFSFYTVLDNMKANKNF